MTLRGDPSVGTADISPVRGDKTTRTNGVRPMLPLKGEVGRLRPTRRGLCTAPSIFHRTSGVLTQFVHVSLRGAAKAATWQSASLCTASSVCTTPVTAFNETNRFSKGNALRGPYLSYHDERYGRKAFQRTLRSLEFPGSQTGSPPKPSASGFGGERRSSGVSELFALGRKRGIRSLRRRSANAFALTYRCEPLRIGA